MEIRLRVYTGWVVQCVADSLFINLPFFLELFRMSGFGFVIPYQWSLPKCGCGICSVLPRNVAGACPNVAVAYSGLSVVRSGVAVAYSGIWVGSSGVWVMGLWETAACWGSRLVLYGRAVMVYTLICLMLMALMALYCGDVLPYTDFM